MVTVGDCFAMRDRSLAYRRVRIIDSFESHERSRTSKEARPSAPTTWPRHCNIAAI